MPAERVAAGTVTKPRLAQAIIERAEESGLPFRWVTADTAYGSAKYLRFWLEQRDRFHVLAIRGKDDVVIGFSQPRAEAVIADLPASAWQRISVECFQQAKDVCGLDQYQARTWRAWHAHITLAMVAHALLAAARAPGTEKGVTRSA